MQKPECHFTLPPSGIRPCLELPQREQEAISIIVALTSSIRCQFEVEALQLIKKLAKFEILEFCDTAPHSVLVAGRPQGIRLTTQGKDAAKNIFDSVPWRKLGMAPQP